MNRIHVFTLIGLSLLIFGCQSSQQASTHGAVLSPIERCQQLIALVDQTVVEAKTTDTSVFRVKGFPYLRTNRFLAAMRIRRANREPSASG